MNYPRPALALLALAPLAHAALPPSAAQAPGRSPWAPEGVFPKEDAARNLKDYEKALAENRPADAVKAKVLLLAAETLTGDTGPGDFLRALAAAAESEPASMRPALRALYARNLRAYADNHAHQIDGRTAGGSGERLEGWGPDRFRTEITRAFEAALADEAALLAIPIASVAVLTDHDAKPVDSDAANPTLFDLIAESAFDYHTRTAPFRRGPADLAGTALKANSPLFGDTAEFLAKGVASVADTNEDLRRAVAIARRRILAHPAGSKARAAAELRRLLWARSLAGDAASRDRIRKSLTTFAEAQGDTPAAAAAYAELASAAREEGELVAAMALAKRGLAIAPGSHGASACQNTIDLLLRPEVSISTERVWNAPWPRLSVVHKNTAKVYFRLVRWDWNEFLEPSRGRPEWLNEREKKQILAAEPLRTWSETLPATPDYKSRTDRFPAPDDLAPGFYYLVASTDENFSAANSRLFYTDFWVSPLAVFAESEPNGVRGRVVDAATGEPLAGVAVTGYQLRDQRDRVAVAKVESDADGAFTLATPNQRGVLLHLRDRQGRELASMQEFYPQGQPRPVRAHNRVVFFTDRAIYRPGQPLQFKGVVLRTDPAANKHRAITERKLTVVLDDANGKEVARAVVTTNAYGAFSGTFEIPRNRLPGTYALHTTGNENGRGYVQVEEYKRPTFETELKAPKSQLAADGSSVLNVTGVATDYTEAPLPDAKVVWRITRETSWPRWCWWRPSTPPEEVASGETVTDAKGEYRFRFDAPTPPRASRGAVPIVTYTAYADVTAPAGETRSTSRAIPLAAVDRQLFLAEPKPGVWEIAATDLSHDPAADIKGTLLVQKLKEPSVVHRAPLAGEDEFLTQNHFARLSRNNADDLASSDIDDESGIPRERLDLSNPANWEPGETVAERPFVTDAQGDASIDLADLPPGNYRLVARAQDTLGRAIDTRAFAQVLPATGDKLGLKVPFVVETDTTGPLEPGDTFRLRWGTGYDSGRALVEIKRRDKPDKRFWTDAGKTLADIRVPITEDDRGGLAVSVTQVRENRLYNENVAVTVPWSDKKLSLTWERFTDKMKPGSPQVWTAVVRGPDGKPAPAEVVATLYDASLDAYAPLHWPTEFSVWPSFHSYSRPGFLNQLKGFRFLSGDWPTTHASAPYFVRGWNPELTPEGRVQNFGMMLRGVGSGRTGLMAKSAVADNAVMPASAEMAFASGAAAPFGGSPNAMPEGQASAPKELAPRQNLNETAFFQPTVRTDKDGVARFEFTVPEALTRWRFLAFAHDAGLRAGTLEASSVTALDLMVRPNAPRFVREGDRVELPVRLINRTDKPLVGKVSLRFTDANRTLDTQLGNEAPERPFTIPALGSATVAWRIAVPDGLGPVAYTVRAVAEGGDADAEAGVIPVLARRIPVVEAKAGAFTGPGEYKLRFETLAASGGAGDTLRSTALRVDTVARPAWYAVMALPYLMEYPHECAEQLFHRYYANALASHIAGSDPKLAAMFKRWEGTEALDSPLTKNEDVKQLLLEETPWVRDAENEGERRRRVALLFDRQRLETETAASLRRLDERRLPDGGWGWFPGYGSSEWVTRTVVLGIGRLGALHVQSDAQVALSALPFLDGKVREHFDELVRNKVDLEKYVPDTGIIQTLQARAYFLSESPLGESDHAYRYFVQAARAAWTGYDRATQGRLALCLPAYGDKETPALIVKSLRERAVVDDDKGMRWNDTGAGANTPWLPWLAPIETQALMVEVFESVAKDPAAADACRLALLAHKRTNAWPSTTATAEACYALLMRGTDLLAGDALVEVSAGGKKLVADKVEPGTGETSASLPVAEITPAAAEIVLTKTDAGPAWVSAYWSYMEDLSRVKDSAQKSISVKKTLWKKVVTKDGPRLISTDGNRIVVGDEIVVRLEVTTDRDLQYVHIKDSRAAGLEPGIVLSGYKWHAGLGYYEAIRDTATHRYVEFLPKGTHVFEISARADRKGVSSVGLAEVQCMYAPEFAAFAGSGTLTVE